jgi:circadian clock protein KaiB
MNKQKQIPAAPVHCATDAFERALGKPDERRYVLRLYVSGMTPNSRKAIENSKRICEENLKGRYELDIIDIYQQPGLAKEDQIVAVPTLVKVSPSPLRRFIGDMSQAGRILAGLDLWKKSDVQVPV